MKGLLIKDFKLLKGQKNFFMTITAISIIMIIVSPGTSFPIGFLGFVGALFSLSSISYDEFDNGNAFLFSLPITRKDYVLEKYIFGLISGIMFLLLGTVINNTKEKRVLEKRGVLMDLTILVVGLILGVGIPLRNKAIKKRRENMKEKGNEEK